MKRTTFYGFAAGVLCVGAATLNSPQIFARTVVHEKDSAPALLRESCDRISRAQGFRFFATTSIEKVSTSGRRDRFEQRVDIVMRRPDCLFAQVRGGLDNVDI